MLFGTWGSHPSSHTDSAFNKELQIFLSTSTKSAQIFTLGPPELKQAWQSGRGFFFIPRTKPGTQ